MRRVRIDTDRDDFLPSFLGSTLLSLSILYYFPLDFAPYSATACLQFAPDLVFLRRYVRDRLSTLFSLFLCIAPSLPTHTITELHDDY